MTLKHSIGCASGALITTALAGLALSACSTPSAPARQPAQANQPLSTGLNTLVGGGDPEAAPVDSGAAPSDAETAERLSLMEQAIANSNFSIDTPAPKRAPAPQIAPSPEPAPVEPTPLAFEPVLGDGAVAPSASEVSAEERLRRSAGDLAEALVQRADGAPAPAAPLAALAALDFAAVFASPESASALSGIVSTAGLRAESRLTPREVEALRAWRAFLASAQATLSDPGAGPGALAAPARALADSLGSWTALSVSSVSLCSRVEGFGTYVELPRQGNDYRFLARGANKMILYAEVENFGRTSKSRDGVWGHEVSLTQSLQLFHAAGSADTLVWQRPEQAIVDFSRRPRRDFFTVQVIELPQNLSVGAYRLKLTVTDKSTGAVAETIVPFEMVADASAMR